MSQQGERYALSPGIEIIDEAFTGPPRLEIFSCSPSPPPLPLPPLLPLAGVVYESNDEPNKPDALVYTDVVPFPTIESRPFNSRELPRQKQMEEQAQIESLSASASSSNLHSPTAPVPAIAAALAAQSEKNKLQPKNPKSFPSSPTSATTSLHSILSTIIPNTHKMADETSDLAPSSRASSTSTVTSSTTSNSVTTKTSPEPLSSRSSSIRSFINSYQKPFNKDRDAGNRPLDHYKNRLPPFRNRWRNAILPIIRWETPILAAIQRKLRNPFFDIYFALSANLGTHNFYVLMLPVSFWYGHSEFGRSLVFVLAFGVYLTNFIKDLLCLPRPLSPPLHRLTMSGSAALEYGFPSTHTANSVSVFMLIVYALFDSKDSFRSPTTYQLAHVFNILYVATIVMGRVYCGMHGFLDVIGGASIGILLWLIRHIYGPAMDALIISSSYKALWVVPFVLFLVRVHPEPADDCPCFDDGVAFMGVVAGTVVGEWHFTNTFPVTSTSNTIPFEITQAGLFGIFLRFFIGSLLISVWKPVIKRALHEALPPLFRYLEKGGMSMPRKFFMPASQYEDIPPSLPDSNLFEPENITSIFKKVGRSRGDSVGPQSQADVYESIAYREYQKQKEINHRKPAAAANGEDNHGEGGLTSSSCLPTSQYFKGVDDAVIDDDEETEHKLMSQIPTPRVRYDVEVVTKLIVYAGIALIAVDLCGVIFVTLGI
jgi:membrane-associated phospholipid phosphatase